MTTNCSEVNKPVHYSAELLHPKHRCCNVMPDTVTAQHDVRPRFLARMQYFMLARELSIQKHIIVSCRSIWTCKYHSSRSAMERSLVTCPRSISIVGWVG
eukprot:3408509-Amphidinium_carterae.1